MIKSIKLANSYPVIKVGFVAKDLSKLYNLDFNTNFSIIILNDFFEQFIKDNSIENKIYPLLNSINKNSNESEITDVSEKIITAITNCDFSEELKEFIDDAYETLPWETSASAGDLLNKAEHKVNIIASPNYITAPIIKPGIDKDLIPDKIKEIYSHFFSTEEIIYRLNSDVDEKFAIALILQRQENFSASAFSYMKKNEDIIKIYVFPGKINPKDIMDPDEEIKPDQYEILKDILKSKTSVCGKQSFKNIDEKGEFKRVECQIKSFILNDSAAIEIARLTKKASTLLEKNVQIIFEIKKDAASIMHVSNILDLQEDYFNKTKNILLKENNIEETNSIEELPEMENNNIVPENGEPEEFDNEISEEASEIEEKFEEELNEIDQKYDEIKETNEELEEVKEDIASKKYENVSQEEMSEDTQNNEEVEPEEEIIEENILEEELIEKETTNELHSDAEAEPIEEEQIIKEEKLETIQEPIETEQPKEETNYNNEVLNSNTPLNELMETEEEIIQEPIQENNFEIKPEEINELSSNTEIEPINEEITEEVKSQTNEQTETEQPKEEDSITDSESISILDTNTKEPENILDSNDEEDVVDIISEEETSEKKEDDFIM